MAINPPPPPPQPVPQAQIPGSTIDLEQARMNLAFLGRIFGSGRNAATNIVGLISLVLLAMCVVALFVDTKIPAGELFKSVLPVITLIVGYLVGKSDS